MNQSGSYIFDVLVHLETGTLKLRHILTINRLMFHYHILSRKDDETIKKIYNKQKTEFVKGDWYQLLLEDFSFIGESLDEGKILSMSQNTYP